MTTGHKQRVYYHPGGSHTRQCQLQNRQLIAPDITSTMPPKPNKSKPTKSKKKSGRQKSHKNTSSSAKSTNLEVDLLSPAAIEDAYYSCHNAVDCLEWRGFGWPKSKKKKGAKRKH